MSNLVGLKTVEGVGYLTLKRSDKKNAINRDLLKDLNDQLECIQNDSQMRALVVCSEKGVPFCAGADLKERQTMSEKETIEFVKTIQKTFDRLAKLEIPTIAMINGFAFGGGLELALACDMRFATKDSLLGLTECAWGIIPGAGGTQRLKNIVGLSFSCELIFSAKKIDGRKAKEIGLVNNALENEEELYLSVKNCVSAIKLCAPKSVKAAKRAIYSNIQAQIDQGLKEEMKAYLTIVETNDRLEGLKAFKEKRSPNFMGT